MQIKPDQLDAHLTRGLKSLYVVAGDEHLLVIEATDRIREKARHAGFTERDVLQAERHFRWDRLTESGSSMSLFGERKLIDLRIPTGKPGRDGSEALQAHARSASPDCITLVTLPRLDREQRNSSWFTALADTGVVLEIPLVERARLPEWIAARLALQGQEADRATLAFLAERVEGNLLAAHQEIQKLGLLFPRGTLTLEAVSDSVLSVARYDVFRLTQALLAPDASRLVRTLQGLRAEGESPVLVQWVMTEEIRNLGRAAAGVQSGRPLPSLLRELRVFAPRDRLYEGALQRLRPAKLALALQYAAELDKMAKGLRVAGRSGNVWDELMRLGLLFTT